MREDYILETVQIPELYEIVEEKSKAGYRLCQMCATAFEGYNEIIYSFVKDYTFENYKIIVNIDDEVKSISQTYPSAMLYENEMKELFGVKYTGISLDYNNNFYRIKKETPFKKEIKVVKKEETE